MKNDILNRLIFYFGMIGMITALLWLFDSWLPNPTRQLLLMIIIAAVITFLWLYGEILKAKRERASVGESDFQKRLQEKAAQRKAASKPMTNKPDLLAEVKAIFRRFPEDGGEFSIVKERDGSIAILADRLLTDEITALAFLHERFGLKSMEINGSKDGITVRLQQF